MITLGGTPGGTRFNPPPSWPDFPQGWEPDSDWQPDPTWPPAPPGWRFWVADVAPAAYPMRSPTSPPNSSNTPIVAAITAGAVVAVGAITLITVQLVRGSSTEVSVARPIPSASSVPLTFVPHHTPTVTDFGTWKRFGGVEATLSADGAEVRLDTHDSVDTWTTKWSGITSPGPPVCSLRLTGRVRDISHAPGIPGGFSIGLSALDAASRAETLTGAAVQFDAGQRGYRLAYYPSDGDSGLIPADLDNAWHRVELAIDTSGAVTLDVDDHRVVSDKLTPTCGRPTIRVWAGAAEFAGFLFGEVAK